MQNKNICSIINLKTKIAVKININLGRKIILVTKDKEKALDMAVKRIEKQFGKGSIMRLGDSTKLNVEAIPTGALPLDLALGVGGIPRGRIIELYGNESSGKTTLGLHIIAEAQNMDGIAAFIDAEHALDPNMLKTLG